MRQDHVTNHCENGFTYGRSREADGINELATGFLADRYIGETGMSKL